MNPTARIVITGLGVVTPSGVGKAEFWEGLMVGRSNISPVPWQLGTGMRCQRVCKVDASGLSTKADEGLTDTSWFALIASREALGDSGLDRRDQGTRIGLALGMAAGHGETPLSPGGQHIEMFRPAKTAAEIVAERLELSGTSLALPVACAAGSVAIVDGLLQLANGWVDAMLVGGADGLSPVSFSGFASLNVLTAEVVRPFDRERSGFLIGEGAGMLVLETYEHAAKRGAHIYGEIMGFGLGADAHHVIHPHPRATGLIHSMCQALKMASCSPESVDYVNAHGTATQANDKSECEAVKAVFGSPRKPTIVNSLKASLGHTMGAAGAIETVGCVLSLAHQCIPPTWNFETVDPECPVDCVANLPRNAPLRRVLKNSSGFGGSNCSLLIGVC